MSKYLIIGILFWSTALYAQKTNEQTLERLMTKNRYYEVLKYINSLYPKREKPADILLYEGKANEGVLRYKEAYHCYSDWLRQDSTNQEARLALARVAALSGRVMKAIDIYEKLAQEDSLDFFVNYQLARLYQQNEKLTSAVQVYKRLYQADTTNSTLLKRMGDCYARMGWNMNAVDCYENAFRLDPEDGKIIVKTINIMMAYPTLFPDFVNHGMGLVDSALVYSPKLNPLKQLRGILLYLNKRYPDCEETFKDLFVQGDSSRINFKYLGLALFRQSLFKEALKPLAFADSLFQDDFGNRLDFDVSMRYGEALGHCKEKQKALKIFQEIEQQMMPDTMTLYRLAFFSGEACKQVDDRKQAIRYYWKAHKFDPKNKIVIYYLTSLHYGLWTDNKRQEASEKEVRQALYFHILFLQKIADNHQGNRSSYHSLSRDILQKELNELFFKNESKMVVIDPNGKKYTYPIDEIKELIKTKAS